MTTSSSRWPRFLTCIWNPCRAGQSNSRRAGTSSMSAARRSAACNMCTFAGLQASRICCLSAALDEALLYVVCVHPVSTRINQWSPALLTPAAMHVCAHVLDKPGHLGYDCARQPAVVAVSPMRRQACRLCHSSSAFLLQKALIQHSLRTWVTAHPRSNPRRHLTNTPPRDPRR